MQLARYLFVASLLITLLPTRANAQFNKTINAVPNLTVDATATWYYADCSTILGVGSFTINIAPKHGSVSFADVSGPIPGCPAGSPSLPAVASYYDWIDNTSTATSDFFELLYQVNGLTQVQDVTVNRTTLQLTFNNAPAPAQKTPEQVVVGEQIVLGLNVSPAPQTKVAWSIPGDPIGGFEVSPTCPSTFSQGNPTDNPCFGIVLPEPATDTPNITFYWVKAGKYAVNVTASLTNGGSASMTNDFDVIGPAESFMLRFSLAPTELLPTSQSPNEISCGNTSLAGPADLANFNPCIDIFAYAYYLSSISANRTFVQLLAQDDDYIVDSAGRTFDCSDSAPTGSLDGTYPDLDFDVIGPFLYAWDVPSWPIEQKPDAISHDIRFKAQTWFMWQAVSFNSTPIVSIPVPLGYVNWSWNTKAHLTKGGWSVDSSFIDPSIFQAAHTYPQWSSVSFLNGSTTCVQQ